MKRLMYSLIAGVFMLALAGSCEEDLLTLGDGVIGGEPFGTGMEVYDVFAYNRNIAAFPTNRLPIYQLGRLNDPVFGTTEGSITAQLNLPSNVGNPRFGTIAQADEGTSEENIEENERVTSVVLYMPFFLNNNSDADSDGVIDELDDEDDNPNNDTDGDGLTNFEERGTGTDPLNPDTDGDGINDADDDATPSNIFPIRREVDSIYGNREAQFNLRVERSTFFLSDFDPNTGFQEPSPNYSDLQISPTFVNEVLADTVMTLSEFEIVTLQEDDPDTETDESTLVEERRAPGILVNLDTLFFQQNFIDLEGSNELLSNANFRDFLRGLHITLTPEAGEELLVLLDFTRAVIEINYEYDVVENEENEGDTVRQNSVEMRFLQGGGNSAITGNAVNTLNSDPYAPEIANALDTDENASRIFLKGGAGTYAEIDLFDQMGGGDIINQIKQEDWIINAAYLIFTVDRDFIDAAGPLDEATRLLVYNTETLDPLYNLLTEVNVAASASGTFLNYDGFLQEENGVGVRYSVNITEHLNDIIIRDSANVRLGVAITPDLRLNGTDEVLVPDGAGTAEKLLPTHAGITPLGTVLVGSNTAPNDPNRLRLEIHYTEVDP
ncbi:protein of unknown function [Robiginitalea myxolifaciens]|uniref:DUF4270 domain-containing protein n=1 Tax=Robiginitalea myxolifaciens TaxID=400055 RepID=A0A1I6G745_9FLAO|nr:DUF4270 domain-containing protein [Robiginitalea myxolifaciens]SFR38009.1 protein of unknown function [Robiginitalea myxolifaciens]